MMFNPQFLEPTWNDYSLMELDPNEANPYEFDTVAHMGHFGFSSSLSPSEDYSDISSSMPSFPSNMSLPTSSDDTHIGLPLDEFGLAIRELDHWLNYELMDDDMEGVCGLMEENSQSNPLTNNFLNEEGSPISSTTSVEVSSVEIDNELGILHLFKAYGEAIQMRSIGLSEVIANRISEKSGPVGATVERLGHYLPRGLDNQPDYLNQESTKNSPMAFQALYDITPYGRVAHFAANTAIIDAIPKDTRSIHIVDFDMREGVQWPPLLEALGRLRTVRLTAIVHRDDRLQYPHLKFEATKRRLSDFARSKGLVLKVEEMEMEELLIEKRRDRKTEWIAFNCMVGLPHLGRKRGEKHAWKFLSAAKEILNISRNKRGIITFGNGNGAELKNGENGDFGSFFDDCLLHSHALFESMEWHFPPNLSLARTAIECLFVGPCVSSLACFSNWQERQETSCCLNFCEGLEKLRLTQESLVEIKEMVREAEGLYEVMMERENEMVLQWKGTPLVKISAWR